MATIKPPRFHPPFPFPELDSRRIKHPRNPPPVHMKLPIMRIGPNTATGLLTPDSSTPSSPIYSPTTPPPLVYSPLPEPPEGKGESFLADTHLLPDGFSGEMGQALSLEAQNLGLSTTDLFNLTGYLRNIGTSDTLGPVATPHTPLFSTIPLPTIKEEEIEVELGEVVTVDSCPEFNTVFDLYDKGLKEEQSSSNTRNAPSSEPTNLWEDYEPPKPSVNDWWDKYYSDQTWTRRRGVKPGMLYSDIPRPMSQNWESIVDAALAFHEPNRNSDICNAQFGTFNEDLAKLYANLEEIDRNMDLYDFDTEELHEESVAETESDSSGQEDNSDRK